MGQPRTQRRRRQRQRPRKRQSPPRPQRGGKMPWVVDVKKGYEVTRDMIKALKKPVNVKEAKRTVAGYKSQYQQCKSRGGTQSYNSWLIDQGYAKRDKTCCIQ